MKEKDFLCKCIQACINSYEGKHGKVVGIFDDYTKHIKDNIEYYLGVKDDTLWVVFRGTDQRKDWIQNFDTHSIDVKEGEMHLGFFEDNIKVEATIVSNAKKYDKIIVTGHSKGGCQALFMYWTLKQKYLGKDIKCVAVAPAKCISKELKKYFPSSQVVTIINGEDSVCKQPFWKFTHMGKVIRIGKRNPLLWIPIVRLIGAWIYHHPPKYLKQMKRYKKAIVLGIE